MATQDSTMYRYSIAAMRDRECLPDILAEDVRAALPSLLYVATSGDDCDVVFPAELSASDKAALDGLVASHPSVAHLKEQRFAQIDVRTRALIAQGFTSSGKVFSLSIEAQSYWTNAYQAREVFTATGAYPLRVNTLDDLDAVDLADEAAVVAFYTAAVGTVKAHLGSGTQLKDQIRAATTPADIAAVVDNR